MTVEQEEYIHAIPHRQPSSWLHGAYLQSFDTTSSTTTLTASECMKLFLLAYRPQVMTELYS